MEQTGVDRAQSEQPLDETRALRSAHRVSLTDEQAAALLDRYCFFACLLDTLRAWDLWQPPSPLARQALELLREAKDRLRREAA